MELTGDLSDFSLADILQILALSRKTGTLLIENGRIKGRIILESGRIIDAWTNESGSFKEHLTYNGIIPEETLAALNKLYVEAKGAWDFESLLVESGLLRRRQVEGLYKKYLQSTIACLLPVEKGRFGIVLNDISSGDVPECVKLEEGLSIEEVLLDVARERDETTLSSGESCGSDNLGDLDLTDSVHALGLEENEEYLRGDCRDRVLSMLSELCTVSFETDVSLMLLRCTSEFARRGILFGVRDDCMYGIGQFGFECSNSSGLSVSTVIRSIDSLLNQEKVIADIAHMKQPCFSSEKQNKSGRLNPTLESLVGHLGDISAYEWFMIPVVCLRSTRYVIYGDNYPETSGMLGLKELLVLADQAGLVLEKLTLQRLLQGEPISAG